MNSTSNHNSLNRRELLQTSGCGLGTLALAGMMSQPNAHASQSADRSSPLAAASSQFPAKAKRIIHLFMNGGPSQFDTFYRKPLLNELHGKPLPKSVADQLQPTQRKRVGTIFGSPFPFRKYGQCGLEVSSLYPNVAKHADELCVVHSMQGEVANHTPGLLLTNCGHSALPRPSLGAWLLYGLGNESENLPGFVVLCPKGMPTAQSRNWTSAFLPGVYQGTHVETGGGWQAADPQFDAETISGLGSQREHRSH